MKSSSYQSVVVEKFLSGAVDRVDDCLAREEPLEIQVAWLDATGLQQSKTVAITMCTPGNARELAIGFLLGEGMIRSLDQVEAIYNRGARDENQLQHSVRLTLRPGTMIDLERLQRNFYTTSSCGVCGKTSLEALALTAWESIPEPEQPFAAALISTLPEKLRESQELFSKTGGVHGAGLFDWQGRVVHIDEDVGRHNAVDKVIGKSFLHRHWPLGNHVLVVSGRASFELVQKAIAAQIPILVAVGAPSSVAVEAADKFGLTLIGFTKKNGFNLYTHPRRIKFEVRQLRDDPSSLIVSL